VRVAIVGCIHANLPAFEAVLADATRAGASRVVCAGDIVGWGPQPRETLALLRSRGIPSIRGHDDRRVVDLALDLERGEKTAAATTARWTLERLDAEDVRMLTTLPLSYGFAAVGRTIVVVHGTPRDEDEVLLPTTPARRLNAFLVLAGADVLACAHGHQPFVRELEEGRLVVNVGSVGRSFDGDPRAAYALIDLERDAAPRAEIRHVDYDVKATLAAACSAGAPRRVRDELRSRVVASARRDGLGLLLTAPHRGPTALRALAERTIRRAAKRLQKAGRDRDDLVVATHDARVAVRRLLAAFDVFSGLLPAREREPLERALRLIMKDLSAVRDLDVAEQILAATATTEPTAAVALDTSLETLALERAGVDSARERALSRAGRRWLRRELRALARHTRKGSVRTIGERLGALAADARVALGAALARDDDDTVHRFRVAMKRLRYALEPFDAIDPAAGSLARSLGEAQDHLGAARDRSQLAIRLDAEAERLHASGRPALATAVQLLAQGYRREARGAIDAFRRSGLGPEARAALALGETATDPEPDPAPTADLRI
jgi:CHAD domain-containing protein/predicted phosphodiesterase